MSRGRSSVKIPEEYSDLSKWPKPLVNALMEEDQERYRANAKAIEMYAQGYGWKHIMEVTGLPRYSVRNLISRALTINETAEIYGFFAAIPGLRLKQYERNAPEKMKADFAHGGLSGVLGAVLRKHPDIGKEMTKIVLKYSGTNADSPGPIPWISILSSFHKLCSKAGIARDSWPFTAKYQGYESIRKWGHKILHTHKERGAVVMTGTRTKKMLNAVTGETSLLKAESYGDIWELDSHEFDVVGTIAVPLQNGGYTLVPISRINAVLIADRDGHAIISWLVSFNAAITANDILRCVSRAINPWIPEELTIPGLVRDPSGGMPTYNFPQLAGTGCALLLVDNASAHLAKRVERKIRNAIGCAVNYGEVASPNRRPLIEAINFRLEQLGFRRLPSATKSKKIDAKSLSPSEKAIKHEITQDGLIQHLDCIIWRFNGLPTEGLGYMSPLERIALKIQSTDYLPLVVPQEVITENSMCTVTLIRKLAGNPLKGRNLHINLEQGRYTSHALINSGLAPGTSISIEFDEDADFRSVKASVTGTGRSLGVLKVTGQWARSKHDRRTRQIINRLKNKRLLRLIDGQDPVEVYMQSLANKAASGREKSIPKISKSGTELNRVHKITEREIPAATAMSSKPRLPIKKISAVKGGKGKLDNYSR